MSSLYDLIPIMARDSASGDTAASAAANKSGVNFRVARRLAGVADGFIAQATDRAR